MESAIAKLAACGQKLGLGKFLLGIQNGPMVTIHFNDMSIKGAMEVVIAAFHQVVRLDVERNPQFSDARKAVYKKLSKDFDALIRAANKEFEKHPQ